MKYHLRSGAINQLILPTNVSSKYDRYVTSLAVLPTATNTPLHREIDLSLCSAKKSLTATAKTDNVKPGRRDIEKKIAPERGDVTNGKGQ